MNDTFDPVNDLAERVRQSKGEEKRRLLLEMCEYRTQTADKFFSEKLGLSNKNMIPYYCFSRCDAVSDLAAGLLSGVVDKMAGADCQYSDELSKETFIALSLSVFKQSDKMLAVLRKIGASYAKIKSMEIKFLGHDYIPFFRNLATEGYAHCCESNFIRLLNDLLILTVVRSDFEFSGAVKSLYADYPQAYGCAAFFVYFTEDNTAAYELFGTSEHLTAILNTMNGTFFDKQKGQFYQGLPYWFYGVRQKIWGEPLPLDKPLDINWVRFLCRVSNERLKQYYNTDLSRTVYRKFDNILINLIISDDLENNAILREHFKRSAPEGGAPVSFKALAMLDFNDHEELVNDICSRICSGDANYFTLYNAFSIMNIPKADKLALLKKTERYLLANEHDTKLKGQREEFSKEITLYRQNKNGRLKNKITV